MSIKEPSINKPPSTQQPQWSCAPTPLLSITRKKNSRRSGAASQASRQQTHQMERSQSSAPSRKQKTLTGIRRNVCILRGRGSVRKILLKLANCRRLQERRTISYILSSNLYVDDLIAGTDTEKKTLSIILEAGFQLRKIAFNSAKLQKLLPTYSYYFRHPVGHRPKIKSPRSGIGSRKRQHHLRNRINSTSRRRKQDLLPSLTSFSQLT